MRKTGLTIVSVTLALLSAAGFALVGLPARHAGPTGFYPDQINVHEKLTRRGEVRIVARHCQKYGGDAERCAEDPSTIFSDQTVHNLLVNVGRDIQAKQMGDTAAQPASCNYIALTNTAISPAAGDTALTGEIAANGLSRAQGAFAHTTSACTFTITKTFTCITAAQAAQAGAIFNASSGATMCFENTFTAVSLQVNDTLQVTWTVTYC